MVTPPGPETRHRSFMPGLRSQSAVPSEQQDLVYDASSWSLANSKQDHHNHCHTLRHRSANCQLIRLAESYHPTFRANRDFEILLNVLRSSLLLTTSSLQVRKETAGPLISNFPWRPLGVPLRFVTSIISFNMGTK